jgi:hypothetical protein
MRHQLRYCIGVFLILVAGCNSAERELKTAIEAKLNAQPEMTLQDIYKDFFQDEFGPGHLLSNPASARSYFDEELKGMTSRARHDAEPCGLGKNFVRVPMDLVKDGLIDKDEFFDAFVESSKNFRTPDLSRWIRKWQQIEAVINKSKLELRDLEQNRTMLREMLNEGKTMVHHSDLYRENYDPHYRIMGTRQWEQLKLKLRR